MRSSSREHKDSHFATLSKIGAQQCITNYRQVFWLAPYIEAPSHPAILYAFDSGTMLLGLPIHIGADAHSGATAADFNRVPISTIPKQNAPEPAIRHTTFSKNSRINIQSPDKSQEKNINIYNHAEGCEISHRLSRTEKTMLTCPM